MLNSVLPTLVTLSCFAGIGGTELACRSLGGFDVVDAIEKNPYRQRVLKKNFPNLNIHDDIRDFTSDKRYDLIVSTFPCKGMSYAGKGEGYDNEYSALWWESYRLIKTCKPTYVVIENVRGFLQRGACSSFNSLRMAGYTVDPPEIISAKEVGACHQRERVFIVAYKPPNTNGTKRSRQLPLSWTGQIGSQIEAVKKPVRKNNSQRPQFPSFDQGVVNGLSPQLDGYQRGGWWLDNPFYGDISAPKRSISDRQKRISALGDSVTPQQMAIPLMRVKYLQGFFAGAEQYDPCLETFSPVLQTQFDTKNEPQKSQTFA